MKKHIFFTLFLGIIFFSASATTWYPTELKCPLCNAKNTYQQIGSYGGYIYSWPSKFQYIFWPFTESPTFYCCPKCHLSVLMWDFDSIPDDKSDALKAYLQTVAFEEEYKDYQDIPLLQRLEIAEQVYLILERDNDFWCRFYRVMGYHYESEQDESKALIARTKALDLAFQMLIDPAFAGREKENCYIIACMYYFMGQKEKAMEYLGKAQEMTYTNSSMEKSNQEGLDSYLSDLIVQYKERIAKGE